MVGLLVEVEGLVKRGGGVNWGVLVIVGRAYWHCTREDLCRRWIKLCRV